MDSHKFLFLQIFLPQVKSYFHFLYFNLILKITIVTNFYYHFQTQNHIEFIFRKN